MARARTPLSRERVLQTAVRMADEDGIEALTMRKLAGRLRVEAMSLYNHVANKADLVDGMADLVLGEIELPATADWEDAIRGSAISAHDAFVRHPWVCSLVITPASRRPQPTRLRHMEWLLGRLDDAGFSTELTYHAYHVLDSHLVGFTLWELGHTATAKAIAGEDMEAFVASFIAKLRADGLPLLADHAEQHLDPPPGKGGFELGLDLILEGLKKALND
jgi:AcrR family transcriptional regulator